VLSCRAGDAAASIWSTKAGLTRIGALNFKLQTQIDPNQRPQRAQLYFLNYALRDVGNGVKIYSRGKMRGGVDGEKLEEADADHEKGDGDLMQAMFDESAAMAGAFGDNESSSLADLEDLQEEYDQAVEIEDSEVIEDIFAANELGEELYKFSIEKAKEAKK